MFGRIVVLLIALSGFVAPSFSTPPGIGSDLAVLRLCNASSSVTLEAVNSVLIHRDTEHPEARTDAFKCFLLCLYVEYGWMDRNGGFELHAIRPALLAAEVPEDRIRLLLYTCTSTESADPCHRAFLFTECFWSHAAVGDKFDNENAIRRQHLATGFP